MAEPPQVVPRALLEAPVVLVHTTRCKNLYGPAAQSGSVDQGTYLLTSTAASQKAEFGN